VGIDESGENPEATERPLPAEAAEDTASSGLRGLWRNPAYRFVFLFLVYLALVSVLYPVFTSSFPGAIRWLIDLTAQIEYWLFRPFTQDVSYAGNLVVFHGFSVKIIVECTGIYEILIFSAAVLAFPTSIRKKLIGLLLGGPLLYFFNVIRIVVLIIVGRYWFSIFDFMHIYFWQATLILMITSVWLLWIFKVVRDDE
jgi:archaeosortase B (VPXXXP-CTERM-specific)